MTTDAQGRVTPPTRDEVLEALALVREGVAAGIRLGDASTLTRTASAMCVADALAWAAGEENLFGEALAVMQLIKRWKL